METGRRGDRGRRKRQREKYDLFRVVKSTVERAFSAAKEGRGGRKRPLCSVHPGSHVNHGPRETGRRIGHSFTNALIGARVRTHARTRAHTVAPVCGAQMRVNQCALCVGAADNMQLRAVSSTLPCSHSVFRALSPRNAFGFRRCAWRKRRHRIRTTHQRRKVIQRRRNHHSSRLLVVSLSRGQSGMTIVTG